VVLDETAAAGLEYVEHYRWIDANKLSWQRYE